MNVKKEALNKYFVDESTFVTVGKKGSVVCIEARNTARFLLRLKKISQLCGMFDECLELPKLYSDVKHDFKVEKRQCKNLIKILLGVHTADFLKLEAHFPEHTFCPYTEALLEAMKEYRYFEIISYRELYKSLTNEQVVLLKDMIKKVRAVLNSKGFKSKVSNHERAARKNASSSWSYVKNLFQNYARMLVVRIDFHYREQFARGKEKIPFDEAKKHRDKLLRSMRYRKEFKYLVGMIWKVEYTPMKGYHIHGLLFFDGNKRCKIFPICKGIHEFWRDEVTSGRGYAFAVDPGVHKYKYPFVGMVRYDEEKKMKGLKLAIEYMAKVDFLAKLNVPGRLFGRKVIKPIQGKKRGRPRLQNTNTYAA
nr:inovirus-type Gp2 protein [uncultured Halomonas sp.]